MKFIVSYTTTIKGWGKRLLRKSYPPPPPPHSILFLICGSTPCMRQSTPYPLLFITSQQYWECRNHTIFKLGCECSGPEEPVYFRFWNCRVVTQTAVVWTCLPLIRSSKNHLARCNGRGKKTKQTEEEAIRKHQRMHRPGVRQVPKGSGEQKNGGKWLGNHLWCCNDPHGYEIGEVVRWGS